MPTPSGSIRMTRPNSTIIFSTMPRCERAERWCAPRPTPWRGVDQVANDLLPDVDITRLPAEVSAAPFTWPRFGSRILPADMSLEHKPRQGRVDLSFHKCTVDQMRRRVPATLPIDVQLMKAGESAALSIAVPRIDHLRLFEEQHDEVLSALAAVERLLAIGRGVRAAVPG